MLSSVILQECLISSKPNIVSLFSAIKFGNTLWETMILISLTTNKIFTPGKCRQSKSYDNEQFLPGKILI